MSDRSPGEPPLGSLPVVTLDLQVASAEPDLPGQTQLTRWAAAALAGAQGAAGGGAPARARAELTVRIVDEAESQSLNRRWRGIDRPTNVLSFPFDLPPGLSADHPAAALLGDLVLCAPLVRAQALEQGKARDAHWAHLVVHGVLHLLDFDHRTENQANRMEMLETLILTGLGFPPPYATPGAESADLS